MMAYMGFTDRPVVPQLVLIDRAGNIHYATPRNGDAESMKEEMIQSRIEELLAQGGRAKRSYKTSNKPQFAALIHFVGPYEK